MRYLLIASLVMLAACHKREANVYTNAQDDLQNNIDQANNSSYG